MPARPPYVKRLAARLPLLDPSRMLRGTLFPTRTETLSTLCRPFAVCHRLGLHLPDSSRPSTPLCRHRQATLARLTDAGRTGLHRDAPYHSRPTRSQPLCLLSGETFRTNHRVPRTIVGSSHPCERTGRIRAAPRQCTACRRPQPPRCRSPAPVRPMARSPTIAHVDPVIFIYAIKTAVPDTQFAWCISATLAAAGTLAWQPRPTLGGTARAARGSLAGALPRWVNERDPRRFQGRLILGRAIRISLASRDTDFYTQRGSHIHDAPTTGPGKHRRTDQAGQPDPPAPAPPTLSASDLDRRIKPPGCERR